MPINIAQDFAARKTSEVIVSEVFPALEKAARTEFSVITLNGAPVEADDVEDVEFSLQKMEAMICGYLRQLAQMHIHYGQLYAGLEDCDRSGLDGKLNEFIDRHRGDRLTT